jgi:murein tripeptide amidase MpaA
MIQRRGALVAAAVAALSSSTWGQAIGPGATRYDGSKVVRVNVRSARELQTVLALTDDVWSHRVGVGGPVDVRVTPEQWAAMQAAGLDASVEIDNVQALIDAEGARLANRLPAGGAADGPGWFSDFKTYDEHKTFLQDLVAAHPNLAQMIVIGQSREGRDIFGIRITGPGSVTNRPAALYFACQHAREWATPPTVAYIAYKLLNDYGTDCAATNLVNSVEFFLIPIVNPDGYAWTWATGGDRLWRKNKRPGCTTGNPPRYGVDLNRNWGYQWGGEGASTSQCSDTYRGPGAFSEPETQAMRNFVLANPRIKATMDFHSYSQLVMSPWGYTSALPPNNATFIQQDNAMAAAILASHGRTYLPGPIYTTIYPASGVSVDWAFGTAGAWAFTIEVRPTTSNPGFVLPPGEIIPCAEENYAAILALSTFIGNPPTGCPSACYADCNGDGVLGLADFGCFQTKFALNDLYADCNGDGVLGLADFGCFQTRFALGCP